jgi:hypothetical protein
MTLTETKNPYAVSIMLCYCIALHMSWSVILILDPAAIGATALSVFPYLFRGPDATSAILLFVGLLAAVTVLLRFPGRAWLLLPQQVILLVSAYTATAAAVLGQYADGVPRPAAFILADQLHSILAAGGHAVAIFALWRADRQKQ